MEKSGKIYFLSQYKTALLVAVLSIALRLGLNIFKTTEVWSIVAFLRGLLFVGLSIFGLALILKLILDRNGIQPPFKVLSNKAALSLVPIFILQPILTYVFYSGFNHLFYLIFGGIILFFLIQKSFQLSYRKSFFIAGFSFFSYFVLITIFYAIRI